MHRLIACSSSALALGLLFLSLTPAAPVEVGAIDTPAYAYGVSVVGGLAYVADETSGLRVIDAVPEPRAFLLQIAAVATLFAIRGRRGRCRR